jgi:hypothetical protein
MNTRLLRSFGLVEALILVVATSVSSCGQSGGSSSVPIAQSSQPRDTKPIVSSADASQLANDNRAFAVSLYQALRTSAGSDDNLVFSPTSISIALAMLYNGAANDTAQAIASALDFTLPVDRLNAAFNSVDLALTTPPEGQTPGRSSCRWPIRSGRSGTWRSRRHFSTRWPSITGRASTWSIS